jgi:hypothetical protein
MKLKAGKSAVRKIYPWLPSYDSAFVRAEPLTRIRDIAHRNDIPGELKKEIKHTLQNKLHRCANPEDLATSAALLERVNLPDAHYSPSFVEEFKIFHEELKQFFNARSLEERLEAMIRKEDIEETDLIWRFLDMKKKQVETSQHLVAVIEILTELRSRFLIKAGIETSSVSQQLRLADIGLEDFAFVFLSRLINRLDLDGAEWESALKALALAVSNLCLSSIAPEECAAVESELNAMSYVFNPSESQQLLRLKATLDRCRRLCDGYSDRVLSLFPENVEKLGQALGVSEHAIKAFCEGDIRGNLVFQLSKLVSILAAVHEIESGLKELEGSPYMLIEYAVGLDPEIFLKLFEKTHDIERVSACVDIGHIGIRQTRDAYSQNHPGEDVCALTPYDPRLLEVIDDVGVAVHSALPMVLDIIKELGNFKKHVHFHLHDGHPLSSFSPFGISDHMSFLDEIPIPFEYKGKRTLHPMFGPSGLSRIVTESLKLFGPDRLSFTLEIHPMRGRLPLGNASYLFDHWADRTNAERMNYWLSLILKNHKLLLKACKKGIRE